MKRRTAIIAAGIVGLVFVCSGIVFAQAGKEGKEAQSKSQPPAVPEADLQWLWGEIVAVNSQSKEMKVKYIDYETDTEKEVNIYVDDKTTFENVETLDSINPQDGVSIDYIIGDTGKFIAKNVSLEKAEDMEETGEVVASQEESKDPAASEASPVK
ncbi:MAG: hypothetical protein WC335_03240 [Candidatus Omnitrophota bacterium]|jgi:hypothetical protein